MRKFATMCALVLVAGASGLAAQSTQQPTPTTHLPPAPGDSIHRHGRHAGSAKAGQKLAPAYSPQWGGYYNPHARTQTGAKPDFADGSVHMNRGTPQPPDPLVRRPGTKTGALDKRGYAYRPPPGRDPGNRRHNGQRPPTGTGYPPGCQPGQPPNPGCLPQSPLPNHASAATHVTGTARDSAKALPPRP